MSFLLTARPLGLLLSFKKAGPGEEKKKRKLETGLFLGGLWGQQDCIDSQHLILRTAKV